VNEVASILSSALFLLDVAIVLYLVPRIVIQRRESAATLAWVLFIILLPFGGAFFFHLLGTRRLQRRRARRARTRALIAPAMGRISAVLEPYNVRAGTLEDQRIALATRLFNIERSVATKGNELTVVHGEAMFRELEEAIRSAETYVHVQFYIFHPDATGQRVLAALEERARAGVEVRLLIDAVGARDLKHRFVEPLLAAGGKVAQFLPVNPITKPFSVNFRNHRKIVVVDGRLALTGGMNVGDEYLGRKTKHGRWRDTHVIVRGPAALRLQEIFADDWHFSTDEELVDPRYYPTPERPGSVVMQVVASGPDATAEAIHRKVFTAITKSEQRVWLTTPYFIPDRAIQVALYTAARRGVDVRLLLPGTSDHLLVLYAGRSFYDELLEAGVRIFEYELGMLHAKTMVVDDLWVTIGSANTDMRSFVLNWEANLVALDSTLAHRMGDTFLEDLKGAKEIRRPRAANRWDRFKEAGSYVLSPLL
jgi:cardiolipin synthase A/B